MQKKRVWQTGGRAMSPWGWGICTARTSWEYGRENLQVWPNFG